MCPHLTLRPRFCPRNFDVLEEIIIRPVGDHTTTRFARKVVRCCVAKCVGRRRLLLRDCFRSTCASHPPIHSQHRDPCLESHTSPRALPTRHLPEGHPSTGTSVEQLPYAWDLANRRSNTVRILAVRDRSLTRDILPEIDSARV